MMISLLTHICVTWPQWVNKMSTILQIIFLNVFFLNEKSLYFDLNSTEWSPFLGVQFVLSHHWFNSDIAELISPQTLLIKMSWNSKSSVYEHVQGSIYVCAQPMRDVITSVHENHRTCRTFLMARPKCLMRDFTNLNRIYTAHRTNVWWAMKVFQLHCITI